VTTKKSTSVKFSKNPPRPRRTGEYDWQAIARKLRQRPGEWALIFEGDRMTYVTAFRLNSLKDLPLDEFEVRTVNTTKGITKAQAAEQGIEPEPRICDMWLRYVPKERA